MDSRPHDKFGAEADSYVALFSRFSTCGAWEVHYILDFIEENKCDV
jgi:hypothetical protein